MGIRIEVDLSSLAAVAQHVSRLGTTDTEPLMTNIGGLLEKSTRERIEETKTSPDGAAWPPNRAGTSTLLDTGKHLRDSIAFISAADQVEVGSSWEFAHVHQEGAVITPKNGSALKFWIASGGFTQFVMAKRVTIPARPFVGLSAEDADKVDRVATDFLSKLIGGSP
jgi:phage gpG-like protein